MRSTYSGFSLVELSIVLVILGLLVGGILGGQSLIRAAELRSITTDLDKFQTAINSFRGKYNALPGDMTNAIDYWGAAHATPATCYTTVGTGTQTCNGDGNGQISVNALNANTHELFRLWQQLANAGLVEGNFTGVSGSGSAYESKIRTNVPASRINGAGYTIYYLGTDAGAGPNYFPSAYKNSLHFGAEIAGTVTGGAAIAPEDAFAIDSKLDDGKPGTGNVMTFKSSSAASPGCASSDTYSTATYSLSSSGSICSLIFKLGF